MTSRPRRSVLYMPGSKERALQKGRELATDAIIFDLEDAVSPDMKEAARELLAAALSEGGYGKRETIVRTNGIETAWFEDDLAMAAKSKPDAILIPKVSSSEDLKLVRNKLSALGGEPSINLWAMMETPLAMLNALEIAQAGPSDAYALVAFVMGTNDLAKETGAALVDGRLPMASWLSTCVAAGSAFDIDVIDGVFNDFKNDEGFCAECAQGRDFGMAGKTLIHPAQIDPANKAFAPSQDQVAWAQKIIDAFQLEENKGKGAITVDGKMVELLHAEMAKKTVAIAQTIADMQAD